MSFKRRPHSDSDTDTDAAGPAPHAFNQIGVHAPRAQLLEIGPDGPKTEDTGTALAGPLPRHVTGESSRLGDATRSADSAITIPTPRVAPTAVKGPGAYGVSK